MARGLALDIVTEEVTFLETGAEGALHLALEAAFAERSREQADVLAIKTATALRSVAVVMLDRWSSERGITMGALWEELSSLLVQLFDEEP